MQTVSYRESEFDDEQRAWMVAYGRHVADVGQHGHLRSEAMSDLANPNNYEGGYRYIADAPLTDWAEKARLDRMDAWRAELGEKANMNGLVFPVRKLEY